MNMIDFPEHVVVVVTTMTLTVQRGMTFIIEGITYLMGKREKGFDTYSLLLSQSLCNSILTIGNSIGQFHSLSLDQIPVWYSIKTLSRLRL